jgi:hypothetical protein
MAPGHVYYTVRRDTRHALREIFREISGYQLNTSGEFSAATLEGNLHLSPVMTDLYHWLRAIFSGLMDVRGVSGDSLTQLRKTIQAAERGVKEACERGTPRDAIAQWVLVSFRFASSSFVVGAGVSSS